jgi:hypothetical protein
MLHTTKLLPGSPTASATDNRTTANRDMNLKLKEKDAAEDVVFVAITRTWRVRVHT